MGDAASTLAQDWLEQRHAPVTYQDARELRRFKALVLACLRACVPRERAREGERATGRLEYKSL